MLAFRCARASLYGQASHCGLGSFPACSAWSTSPLVQPGMHLLNLGALRCLDLVGQIHDTRINPLLALHDVAHFDRLLVMLNRVLRERHIRWIVSVGA